jgi:hypothetical protein
MVHCFRCKKELDLPQKITFRATCDHCQSYLHCCKNCRFYKPGLSNDCAIPGTESISDRLHMNYCEEFALLHETPPSETNTSAKDKFNSLFKDI